MRGDARAAAVGLFAPGRVAALPPLRATACPTRTPSCCWGGRSLRGGAHAVGRALPAAPAGAWPRRAPYFVPAHRALVDLALESRAVPAPARRRWKRRAGGPAAARGQPRRARLPARPRPLPGAATSTARRPPSPQVGRAARASTPGAAYFRGLIAARRGAYEDARGAFCEILPGKARAQRWPSTSTAATSSCRTWPAWRSAASPTSRTATTRPTTTTSRSPRTPSAWPRRCSRPPGRCTRRARCDAARAFVEAFDRGLPRLAPARRRWRSCARNLAVRSCAFDGPAPRPARLVRDLRAAAEAGRHAPPPIRPGAAGAGRPPAGPRARPRRQASDADGRLLALLKLDGRFRGADRPCSREIDARPGRGRADGAVAALARPGRSSRAARCTGRRPRPRRPSCCEEVEALLPMARWPTGLGSRASTSLLLEVSLLAHPPRPAGPYAAEAGRPPRALAARAVAPCASQVRAAAQALAAEPCASWTSGLRALFARRAWSTSTRWWGNKKRLEIEIANLRAGRYAADAVRTSCKAEGTLGDDEEYWPFEGEYWSDEYENFKMIAAPRPCVAAGARCSPRRRRRAEDAPAAQHAAGPRGRGADRRQGEGGRGHAPRGHQAARGLPARQPARRPRPPRRCSSWPS